MEEGNSLIKGRDAGTFSLFFQPTGKGKAFTRGLISLLEVVEYEERSFENRVYFYREELKEIINGFNARDLFPYGSRLRLKRKEILSLNCYNELVLSDKAVFPLMKLGELDVSKVIQSKEKGYISIIVNIQ